MKKLVILLTILMLVGCGYDFKVKYTPSYKDDPIRKQIEENNPIEKVEYRTLEDINRELDSLTAEGEYCLVRGAERNLDTIIDHIHYIFTTEE